MRNIVAAIALAARPANLCQSPAKRSHAELEWLAEVQLVSQSVS